jgi:NADPH:quinone reductase-like Zn-dependent oxidoreductase
MRAIAVTKFGDTPELMELPKPEPGPGEVLVELAATSINPLDLGLAEGAFEGRIPHIFPFVLGIDGAGRVVAAGDEVTGLRPGDLVHGQFFRAPTGTGTYADYVVTPEHPGLGALQLVPDGIPLGIAGAIPTAGMTAFGAVAGLGLRPGQSLLILGATGGVGVFAVQLAAALGAEVIATARPNAAEWVRQLGAGETIDYTTAGVAEQVAKQRSGGIDAVLDLGRDKEAFAACAALVRDGGTALSVAFGASPELLASTRISVANYTMTDKPALLAGVTAEVVAGRLEVPVQRTVSLEQVPEALGQIRGGGARGKTVIEI